MSNRTVSIQQIVQDSVLYGVRCTTVPARPAGCSGLEQNIVQFMHAWLMLAALISQFLIRKLLATPTPTNPQTSADVRRWLPLKPSTAGARVGQPPFTSSQHLLVFRMETMPFALPSSLVPVMAHGSSHAQGWIAERDIWLAGHLAEASEPACFQANRRDL